MSLFKKFSVVRSDNNQVEEEFSTKHAAEVFQEMLAKKGVQCIVRTNDEDAQDELAIGNEEHATYDIEGLDPVEPDNEFGSEMDEFNDDSGLMSADDFDEP